MLLMQGVELKKNTKNIYSLKRPHQLLVYLTHKAQVC